MSSAALTRLRKELIKIQKEPVPLIDARPLESNLFEWHYAIQGAPGTVFEGGVYHGKVVFPPQYPYKPPTIHIMTPNGVFDPKVTVCTTMSDYHPETWNPLWNISSILSGLQSLMMERAPTMLSAQTTSDEKRAFARASLAFNRRNKLFLTLFPQYAPGAGAGSEAKNGHVADSAPTAAAPSPSSPVGTATAAAAAAAAAAGVAPAAGLRDRGASALRAPPPPAVGGMAVGRAHADASPAVESPHVTMLLWVLMAAALAFALWVAFSGVTG